MVLPWEIHSIVPLPQSGQSIRLLLGNQPTMAMATQGLADQDHQHHQRSEPSTTTTTTSIATNRWGPYSGAGDFASNMAVILAALLAALGLGLALNAAVRYLLRRARHRRAGSGGDHQQGNSSGSGRRVSSEEDPEKPPVELEAPPSLVVYSAAVTKLAGAAAECAICLAEFADGDAVRVMPACRHGFHARCIERWLAVAGGRRSSCPTCRAPAAGAAAAAAAQPADESATPSSSS